MTRSRHFRVSCWFVIRILQIFLAMPTTLTPGDIAIIGFNFDNPDEFAFVSLVDLEIGTEIKFTDNGWLSAGGFRANEGTFTWTADQAYSAGTVINPTASGVAFSGSGDQILAYQGDDASPTFIYALNSEGSGVWQSDATSSNTSALPIGLVDGETAVALNEIDNATYTGTTIGTKADLLAAISDRNNWSGSNSNRQSIPSHAFTINGGSSGVLLNETFDYAENGEAAVFTVTDNSGDTEPFFYGTSNFDYLGIFDGDGDGGEDFGGDATNGFNTYTGFADNYLAASDIDGSSSTIDDPAFLTWSGLDISGLSNLLFSVDVATDDTPGSSGLDPSDFLKFEYSIDGGAFQSLLAFETDDDSTNNRPTFLEDTDFDGIGDGTALTNAAQTFTKAFSVSGATLDLRAAIRVDAGFEDIGFDNVVLQEVAGSLISIAATDAVKLEGDAGTTDFTFTVTRSGDTSGAIDVDFAVSGAVDAADFGGTLPSGTLNFADGETSKVLTIGVSGDATPEPDEDFTVTLANATGGTRITNATATGTILTDEVALTKIHEIQGNTDTFTVDNDLVGQTFTIEGIVTADFQGGDGLRGFFVQEESADFDTDVATSEGIFVFEGNTPVLDVNEGDLVRVTGVVNEFNGETELQDISSVQVISAAGDANTPVAAPVSVALPETTNGELEQYEGMLVELATPMTVSQNFFLGRYGQLTLASPDDDGNLGRLFQPTNEFRPLSPEAIDLADENTRRLLVLDDGQDIDNQGDNPNPVPYIGAPGPDGNPETVIRSGDTVTNIVGVLDFGQIDTPSGGITRDYRLHPTQAPTFTPVNLRTEHPEDVGGRLKVASFNVLNYFNGDGQGGGFPTSRGADSASEFARQREKLIAAISAIDADVVGLIELENDGYGPNSAIQDLVNGLNAIPGGDTYSFVDPGVNQLGTDVITVGFIYKTDSVTPVGSAAILDSSVDPRFNTDVQRPALAQTFEEISTGETFTAVNNHLKSKGSLTGIPGDEDQGDGQGNNNLTRTLAAAALTDWLATDPTGSGDSDVLVLGDLNAYAKEDPIEVIKQGADDVAGNDDDYVDLIDQFVADGYSFTFDGQAGYLDHALASNSLATQVTGATEWHINTDEAEVLDYDEEFNSGPYYSGDPYRSSDHDPVIVGLNLSSSNGGPNVIEGTRNDDRIQGTDQDDLIKANNGDDFVSANDGDDIVEGGRGGDIIRGGDGNDILAADRVDRFQDFDGDVSRLDGNNGNDLIYGGSKADRIRGGADDDRMFGKDGNDNIRGGSGNDWLNGGRGDDHLNGGSGVDTADYSDLAINGVFGTIAGLDVNLKLRKAKHSSTNNALGSTDRLIGIENVVGTNRNDRFIGDRRDNLFDGQGEVGRNDRQTTFVDLRGETYQVIADVVEYKGMQADFSFSGVADNFTVTGRWTGTDTLLNIEFLKFDDGVVATSDLF